MKKIIALILASLMLFSVFAGCNVNASTRNSSSSEDFSYEEEFSSNSSEAAANSSSNPTVNSNSASSNVTSSVPETSSDSEDATISESAKQEEMQGSQTTASGFSYEDYRVVTSDYNRNLFYYNELLFEVADPTVIYISDKNSTEYGYFYAYGTSDQIGCVGFQGWRSRDLTNWEDMGPVYLPDFNNCWAYTNYWAPEIVYDETGMVINGETYKYFMFFNAEKYDATQDFVSGTDRSTSQHLSVMYAKEPYGPFYLPNNIKNKDGKTLSVTAPAFDFSFSNSSIASGLQCTNVIDASPFIDEDGTKYMYYSGWGATKTGSANQCIYGVKMKDWFTPDYSTVNVICQTHRMTVGGSLIDHEGRNSGAWVNEGPFMIKRNGTYMMTFSIYPYTSVNYQVRLATSSSPLSGFTKIDPSSGGTVIKTIPEWDGVVQSVGHHSFIEVGDELFIAYHTFKDRTSIASGRALAVDKVLTKTHNGKTILVTNGPSYGYQPLPVEISGYENVASQATVTATNLSAGKEYLTDGFVKYHTSADIGYDIGEATFKPNASVTLSFGSNYKNVRAIMVHFANEWSYSFEYIKKITLTYKSTSGDKTVSITDVKYDYDKFYDDLRVISKPGGSSIIEFAELPIKKIVIEFKDWGANFKVGEIMVLASKTNTTITPVSTEQLKQTYSYTNALVPVIRKHEQGQVLGSVKVGSAELHTTFGYDLSQDDGTKNGNVYTYGPRDQYAFFKGISTDTIYFEAEFNVYITTPYMGDKYPKLGLIAKNSSGCTFFYIDAANNYGNKAVGYTQSQYGGGSWDWASTEEVAQAPTIAYKGGTNYTKLAIARVGGAFYFYVNGVKMFESLELRGMNDGANAGYGFLCFNTGMKVRNYSYILGVEEVEKKIAELANNGSSGEVIVENHIASSVTIGSTTKTTSTAWNLSANYSSDHENYDARKVTLSSTDNQDNYLYLSKNSKRLYAEATFKATGTTANEAWGKFGFLFETEDKNGILYYVDAATGVSTRTCTASEITGTAVGAVTRSNGGYLWSDATHKTVGGKYKGTESITLGIYRQNSIIKCLVNGEVVITTSANISGMLNPAIVSFNIGLEVTNYRITNSSTDEMMKKLYEANANAEVITELVFGNIDGSSTMVQTGTWSKTTNSVSNTGGTESLIYCNTICGPNLYFQGDFTIPSIRNGDKYPKVGIYLRSGTKAVWFYIDAINGGDEGTITFGTNKKVGVVYEAVGTDLAGEDKGFKWGAAEARLVDAPSIAYTGGNTATLAVLYTAGCMYFAVDGQVMLISDGVSGLTSDVNIGILSFNANVNVTNCQGVVSDAGLDSVKEKLGICYNDMTIDGDISDWTGSLANYYEARESASGTGKGFKVMAMKTNLGVYVAYEAICDSINSSNVEWWFNTNVEAAYYNAGGTQTQIFTSIDRQQKGTGLYKFKYTKNDIAQYVVTVEVFVPFSSIGYTGTEEYVVGFFAFRPGKNTSGEETAVEINTVGANAAWWSGPVSPFGLSYAAGETEYKITATGLVGSRITVVS